MCPDNSILGHINAANLGMSNQAYAALSSLNMSPCLPLHSMIMKPRTFLPTKTIVNCKQVSCKALSMPKASIVQTASVQASGRVSPACLEKMTHFTRYTSLPELLSDEANMLFETAESITCEQSWLLTHLKCDAGENDFWWESRHTAPCAAAITSQCTS